MKHLSKHTRIIAALLFFLFGISNTCMRTSAATLYTSIPCKDNAVYLVFSAGYENGHTSTILDILKSNGVSAAFFLTGSYIEHNPGLVSRMKQEGHIVGNHSYSHADFTSCSTSAAYSEISRCANSMS